MIRHLPNSITAIEERLDNGIIVKWETSKADGNTSYNKNVTMDFNVLMPTVEKKSSDVSKYHTNLMYNYSGQCGASGINNPFCSFLQRNIGCL